MPLEFHNNAIVLSGLTGTKLKTEILGEYYDFWQSVTSGGIKRGFPYQTSIVEMNAATCEIYIEDTDEIIPGSASHALELKFDSSRGHNLKVYLIEEDKQCMAKLIAVIEDRWAESELLEGSGSVFMYDRQGIYLYRSAQDFIEDLENHNLGNSLVFFDPLLGATWADLNQIATHRIKRPYESRTEFLAFLYTSDWVLGRGSLEPLPKKEKEQAWTEGEKESAIKADEIFGNRSWLRATTTNSGRNRIAKALVQVYKLRLRQWFRFVSPLGFRPKRNEIYHLFCCSNYPTGIKVVNAVYDNWIARMGREPRIRPPRAEEVYPRFQARYPRICMRLPKGQRKPPQWKTLWTIISQHYDGVCDIFCDNLRSQARPYSIQYILDWLIAEAYLRPIEGIPWAYQNSTIIPQYKLDWEVTLEKLGIAAPPRRKPLQPHEP